MKKQKMEEKSDDDDEEEEEEEEKEGKREDQSASECRQGRKIPDGRGRSRPHSEEAPPPRKSERQLTGRLQTEAPRGPASVRL